MQECLPEAQLASLVEALPLDPEALSPPTSEGVYRLQELVNAPLPFTVVEPEEEGQRPYIRPWRVLDEDGQPRMLSREEAAVAAVESVHDRMAQITEAMYGAGLTNFVPFGLLYERLTLANKVAMEKGMAGEADGIQDVVLNGVVVAKFADKFFNTLDTIVEEMKTEPKLAFDEPQKAHIHELRVARYKRLGLVDWSERPTPDELEPIPLKESWRQLSDTRKKWAKSWKNCQYGCSVVWA